MPGLANGQQFKKSKKDSRISSGSSANAGQNSSYKSIFCRKNPIGQEKIVQYSGYSFIQKYDAIF